MVWVNTLNNCQILLYIMQTRRLSMARLRPRFEIFSCVVPFSFTVLTVMFNSSVDILIWLIISFEKNHHCRCDEGSQHF